ncbi:beta strand repeat-containing protein, partial [Flavobacterium noncentrifugens]
MIKNYQTFCKGRDAVLKGKSHVSWLSSVMLMLLFFSVSESYAQASAYTFAQTSGTFTPPVSGLVDAAGVTSTVPAAILATNWDDNRVTLTMPFSFSFATVNYNQVTLSANGFFVFGSSISATGAGADFVSGTNLDGLYLGGTITNSGVAAFNVDQQINTSTAFTATRSTSSAVMTAVSSVAGLKVGMRIEGTGVTSGTIITAIGTNTITLSKIPNSAGSASYTPYSGVYASVLGTSPNRSYVITLVGARRYQIAADSFDYQYILNEGTNTVQIVYGSSSTTSTAANNVQVGIRTTTSDFSSRTTATSWASTTAGSANTDKCAVLNTILPASGLTFTWTPAVLTACVTPTAQPTALVFNTVTTTSITGSFTAASPAPSKYLVVRSTSATAPTPVNGTTYAVAATTLGAGTYIVQNSNAVTFTDSSLTSGVKYYYYIYSYNDVCTGAPYYNSVSPLSGNKATACAAATSLANTSITNASASLTWTGSGNYIVEYGATGFTQGTGATAGTGGTIASSAATSPYTLSGLSASTTYQVYIRQVCPIEGYSANSAATSFTTLCNGVALPLSNGFTSTSIPSCWKITQVTSATTNPAITFPASGTSPTTSALTTLGANMVMFGSFTSSTAGGQQRLMAAPLTTVGNTSVDVNFQWRNENNASYSTAAFLNEGVQVQYSLDGITYVNAGSFFPRHDATVTSGTAVWKSKTVTLPAAAAGAVKLYVGFLFTAQAGDNCYLDEVSIIETPSCIVPTTVATASVTAHTANVTFASAGTSFIAEYGPTGFTPGTAGVAGTNGTVITGTSSPIALSGLTGSTGYDVYVRQNCTAASNGYSANGTKASFTTAVACPAPTAPASNSVTAKTANVTFTGTGSSYIVEYGPTGFTPGTGATAGTNGTVVTGTSSPIALSGLTPVTGYDVYVRSNCIAASDGFSVNTTKISFTTLVACAAPTAPGRNALAARTVNITFTGTGSSYVVEYGPTGFTPGTSATAGTNGTVVTGSASPVALSGLTPSTGYDVYVRQNCTAASDGYSLNTTKLSFTTLVACSVPTSPSAGTITPHTANISFTSTGTAFVVEYGPTGFTPGSGITAGTNGTIVSGTASPIALSGLAGNTAYDVYVRQNCTAATDGYSTNSTKASFTTLVACAAPTALTANAITTTGASMAFTGSGSSYIIEYGLSGFTPGTGATAGTNGTVVTGSASPIAISGLSSGTTYDVYVRNNCTASSEGYSLNSTKATFATLCTPTTAFPSTETFASYPPNCWREGLSGTVAAGPTTTGVDVNAWTADGFANSGSTGAAKFNIYDENLVSWLLSPQYTLNPNLRLKYNVAANQYGTSTALTSAWESDDSVQLLITTTADNTNWTVLKTYNTANVPAFAGQLESIDLPATYNGQTVRFAFRVVEGVSAGAADIDFFIDNFTIEGIPPALTLSAATSTICAGENSTPVTITSTHSNYDTYVWSPATGVSGTPAAGYTFNPTATTTYTLTATQTSGNMLTTTATHTVTVNPVPTAIVLDTPTASICVGSIQKIEATGGVAVLSKGASSGTINLAIPDNSATGVQRALAVSGIPAGATINKVDVTFSLTHSFLPDAEVTLTAPNGKVIALVADQGSTTVAGSYNDVVITSDNTAPALASTAAAITGTFKANAVTAGSLKGSFGSNLTTNFADLLTTVNGSWTVGAYDDFGSDTGTLVSCSISITYTAQSITWSPAANLFTDAATTVAYVANTHAATVYAKPLTTTTYIATSVTGTCQKSAASLITVNPILTPAFDAVAPICSGAALSALPTTSTNSVTGTWSPALNNTATTEYTFTPTAGQCTSATLTKLTITVNPIVTPIFDAVAPICSGAALSALPTTSTNNVTGTWSPALNNTATTQYTFTPTAGQCTSATLTTMTITVNPIVTPAFTQVSPICSGAALSALPTTSTNGVTGTWSPALNNTITTQYTFTPTAGQCATTTTMTITVNPIVTPTFNAVAPICSGAALSALPTTSTNSITGTWSPALNNTTTTE